MIRSDPSTDFGRSFMTKATAAILIVIGLGGIALQAIGLFIVWKAFT
jgi:hypothetical protein